MDRDRLGSESPRALRDPASGFHLAVDASGRAWVAGTVPATEPGGGSDVFIGRLAHDGKDLDSVTVLGGDGVDAVEAIAIDASGRVAIAGTTRSASMPGIPETVESNGAEAFAALLAPDGRSVVWMTLLGGSGSDEGRALVLDRSGSAWIAGRTTSPDLASGATVAAGSPAGGHDLSVARLEADGTTRWISRLGGDGNDDPRSIVLDSRGDVSSSAVPQSKFPQFRSVLKAQHRVHYVC